MSFRDSKLKYIEDKMFSYETASSHVYQFKELINKIKSQGYIEDSYDFPTAVILVINKRRQMEMDDVKFRKS
jgi:hypothetical protein